MQEVLLLIENFAHRTMWFLFIYMFWTPLCIIADSLDLILAFVLFYCFMYLTEMVFSS